MRLMQYISGDPDLGSSWDCSFNYGCGSSCSGGGCGGGGSSGGGGSGEAIREREPTALTWADVYLLDPVIDRAKGAASISRRGGSVDWL
jgi:hypothetical protein